jgi:type IV secretion system protein VirD4
MDQHTPPSTGPRPDPDPVLAGCTDFATAQGRAGDLLPVGTGDGGRWAVQARPILALLLHAAAVSGRPIQDVPRWINDRSVVSLAEVIDALLHAPTGGGGRAATAAAFWATNQRTRTSLTSTLAAALPRMPAGPGTDHTDTDR